LSVAPAGGQALLPEGLVPNPGVRVEGGLITGLGEGEGEEVDCTGCLLVPGLVDLHTHLYHHATPLGVDPAVCLASGVTTAVDGGSAGACTFPGLRHFVAEPSRCRVLAFLHLAAHGLAAAGCSGPEFGPGGESDSVNCLNTDLCVKTIEANRDLVVGVKIRLDRNITDSGRTEPEVLRRGLEAAGRAVVPLMVHHTNSTLALAEVLGALRPGDIYTHCYSAWAGEGSSLVDRAAGRVRQEVLAARARGVLFDLGHGQGSLDWGVAEVAMGQGFPPDTVR
jgi:dihydroorotase